MTRLFRSKSCGTVGLVEFKSPEPSPFFHRNNGEEEEKEKEEWEEEKKLVDGGLRKKNGVYEDLASKAIVPKQGRDSHQVNHSPVLDVLMAALRKWLLTCSVENDDVLSLDIGSTTNVKHVSHVTFDRFKGFLGLPTDLLREVPRRAPSASAKVFGVSAESMQCSYDERGNSVPTILLKMQKRLYKGGLEAEGVFRINPDDGEEERVRSELNNGVIPYGVDVHCLASLIKAWFRELPVGVLDSLSPEQVMYCNTEDDCSRLVELLPPMEAALLDWAINLMADVVHHEQMNKMNAHNIAMVFAPNMTKMDDPLTALIHAVQVMNLLKTLILNTLHSRPVLSSSVSITQTSESPSTGTEIDRCFEQ